MREGLKLFDKKLLAQGPFPIPWNEQKSDHYKICVAVNKFWKRTPEIRRFVFTVIYKKVEHFPQDRVCCVWSVSPIDLSSLQEEEMTAALVAALKWLHVATCIFLSYPQLLVLIPLMCNPFSWASVTTVIDINVSSGRSLWSSFNVQDIFKSSPAAGGEIGV